MAKRSSLELEFEVEVSLFKYIIPMIILIIQN